MVPRHILQKLKTKMKHQHLTASFFRSANGCSFIIKYKKLRNNQGGGVSEVAFVIGSIFQPPLPSKVSKVVWYLRSVCL